MLLQKLLVILFRAADGLASGGPFPKVDPFAARYPVDLAVDLHRCPFRSGNGGL